MKNTKLAVLVTAAWTTTMAWGTIVDTVRDVADIKATSTATIKRRLRGSSGDDRTLLETVASDTGYPRQDASIARDLQTGSCVLEGNLYGTGQGIFRTIEFRYQGVFAEGTSTIQIIRDILPPFEREVTQGILPDFFACPTEQPTGIITTISPLEDDTLVGGGMF
jgi:hypothetical protein